MPEPTIRRRLLPLCAAALGIVLAAHPAKAENRCIVHQDRGGLEVLVNRCEDCRIASVQRQRPGGGFPTSRRYTVPGGARIQLPFRGPGSTRLLSEEPCEGVSDPSQGEQRDCAHLLRRDSGEVVVMNLCTSCRVIELERLGSDGKRRRETLVLAGRNYAPVAPLGAAQVRIAGDAPCR